MLVWLETKSNSPFSPHFQKAEIEEKNPQKRDSARLRIFL